MKRKVIKLIGTLMQQMGLDMSNRDDNTFSTSTSYRANILLMMQTWTCTSILILLFVNRSVDFYETVINICYFTAGCTTLSGYASFVITLNDIKQLMRIIDDNIFTYPDEHSIMPKYAWTSKEENMVLVIVALLVYQGTCTFIMSIAPILQLLFTGEMEVSVFPMWEPWTSVMLSFVSQFIFVNIAFWFYYLSWIFPIFVCFEFERQCARLCCALNSVQDRAKEADILKQKDYDEAYRENLVQCIRHHQRLVKVFNLLKPWFTINFSVQLLMYTANFGLCFYCLFIPSTVQNTVNMLGMTGIIVFNIFTRCFVGEHFYKMHDQIKDSIFYELNWYEQSRNVLPILKIYHTLTAQKPFLLTGFSIYKATYRTFTSIFRGAYSYLNVLKTTFNS